MVNESNRLQDGELLSLIPNLSDTWSRSFRSKVSVFEELGMRLNHQLAFKLDL